MREDRLRGRRKKPSESTKVRETSSGYMRPSREKNPHKYPRETHPINRLSSVHEVYQKVGDDLVSLV